MNLNNSFMEESVNYSFPGLDVSTFRSRKCRQNIPIVPIIIFNDVLHNTLWNRPKSLFSNQFHWVQGEIENDERQTNRAKETSRSRYIRKEIAAKWRIYWKYNRTIMFFWRRVYLLKNVTYIFWIWWISRASPLWVVRNTNKLKWPNWTYIHFEIRQPS